MDGELVLVVVRWCCSIGTIDDKVIFSNPYLEF
jgi:hypothetical protein